MVGAKKGHISFDVDFTNNILAPLRNGIASEQLFCSAGNIYECTINRPTSDRLEYSILLDYNL